MKSNKQTTGQTAHFCSFLNVTGRKSAILRAVVLVLVAVLSASAQVQRMAIPRGTYRIESVRSGGTGRGSLKSFCIDPHFRAPDNGSQYGTVLAGGGDATVKFPDGKTIPLQKALSDGLVRISGTPFNINELGVTGPPGTEINVGGPLALSAESWLETTKRHRFNSATLHHVPAEAKNVAAADATQRSIWNKIEVEETFGSEGVKFFEQSFKEQEIDGIMISKSGKEPVIYVSLKDVLRTDIMRRDGASFRRVPADAAELNRQQENIFEKVRSLATDNTSYIVLTPGQEPLFISKHSARAQTLEFGEERLQPIDQWLTAKGQTEKPNIVVVSDNHRFLNDLYIESLREQYADRVRIYEDDDPVRAAANVKAQRPIKAGAELAIYSDSSVKTGEILSGLEHPFRKANVRMLNSGIVEAGNVIVVTGHKDEAFRKYLADLALTGALKGKSVALLSCAAPGDREFSRFLLNEGGATCIMRMNAEIDSAAAREVLIKVAAQVNSLPAGGKYLDDLIRDATEGAAQDAGSEHFREQIRRILEHSLQVSLVE